MSRNCVSVGVILGMLVILVWASANLAAVRIYQVDECQNLYMARVLATGQASEFFTNGSLFLLGPLAAMARTAVHSAELLSNARLLFLGVFWGNLLLIALIAGERLSCIRGGLALVAAATLAPLWDYGFEVRHDNVVLMGLLLTWWAVRVKPMGVVSYMLAGAAAISLLFIAVKSVVYVIPLSGAILVFPPPAHGRSRWQLALAWVGGALLAAGLIRLGYGTSGMWEVYLSVFHDVAKYSASANVSGGNSTFGPWGMLSRLLGQTPLLLALGTAATFAAVMELRQRGRSALSWEGNLPEVLLLVGALGALMTNPTPFPYNLLHVVPYVFVLAFRYGCGLWKEIWSQRSFQPLLVTILLFAHLVPFGLATRRHWNWPNFRQESWMCLAEDLTDPVKDPVYDGVGLVPTRSSVDFHWYLHSLNIESFLSGLGPRVCDMLARRPAAVFIPNYRTDWLSEADHAFIREHYVSVTDDFWVLGKVLPAGGGTFEIIHPGRYRIASWQGSDLAGSYPEGWKGLSTPEEQGSLTGTLDGLAITDQPVELAVGIHRIESTPDCQPTVVWVGPRLNRLHRRGQGDHRGLFVNWY